MARVAVVIQGSDSECSTSVADCDIKISPQHDMHANRCSRLGSNFLFLSLSLFLCVVDSFCVSAICCALVDVSLSGLLASVNSGAVDVCQLFGVSLSRFAVSSERSRSHQAVFASARQFEARGARFMLHHDRLKRAEGFVACSALGRVDAAASALPNRYVRRAMFQCDRLAEVDTWYLAPPAPPYAPSSATGAPDTPNLNIEPPPPPFTAKLISGRSVER